MIPHRPQPTLIAAALLCSLALPSCGLIRAPFRIVGSVAGGTYRAGTDLIDSTRTAVKERNQRKEAEAKRAEALAEKEAAAKPRSQPQPVPTDLPLDLPAADAPPLPIEIDGSDPDFLPSLPPLLPPS